MTSYSVGLRHKTTADRPSGGKGIGQQASLELTFAFDEIVLTNTLKKQKQAIRFPAVRNVMPGSCCYLIAASHLKHALVIGITRTDAERAAQNEVVIRTLAMAMPRDELAGRKREDTRLNVRSNHNWLDIFDRIIWLCCAHILSFRYSIPKVAPAQSTNVAIIDIFESVALQSTRSGHLS
jgi:hypothetical protein